MTDRSLSPIIGIVTATLVEFNVTLFKYIIARLDTSPSLDSSLLISLDRYGHSLRSHPLVGQGPCWWFFPYRGPVKAPKILLAPSDLRTTDQASASR